MRNLTPLGHRHPCVVSVGYDPVVEQSQDLLRRLNADLYRDHTGECPRALQFSAARPTGADQPAQLQVRVPTGADQPAQLQVRVPPAPTSPRSCR